MTAFVQVTITEHANGTDWARANGEAPMQYPATYDATKITPLLYETADLSSVGSIEMVGAVEDADLASVVGTGIIEITRSAAIAWGTAAEPSQQNVITDQNAVILASAKAAIDEALTQTEKNALNPDNAEPGINKTQTFAEMMDANYPV